jgi:gluconolactonase
MMKPRAAAVLAIVWCVVACGLVIARAGAQNPPAAPAPPAGQKPAPPPAPLKETVATDIPGVIKGGTKIVLIRAGFNGTEGVIAMPDGSMLFTEQDANRIIKVDRNDNITTYLENTNRTIGLAYDKKGRLIGTQSREPRVGVLAPEPRTVLADSFEGQPLVRPNDLVIDQKGGIYFTDPLGNPQQQFRPPPPGRKPLLFYVRPDGTVIKVTEEITNPNGVQLSPDEKTLYATNGQTIMAFDVQPDGTVRNGRVFAKSGGDGLAIDTEGRLYAAVGGVQGIRVFAPSGADLGTIPIGVNPQSVGFAGPNKKTLYVVGRGALYRTEGEMISQGIQTRAK